MNETHNAGRNTTRSKSGGKYGTQLICAGCRKPAGSDPYCDGDTGHIICARKTCVARLDQPKAARVAYYNRTV